mmetsp:Transcript_23522/g.51602  ORF Transcript_23522/g.51602 Transcript_23522/m.51602 type:complete len:83 (-) Transcript_23522:175-423(-)
MVQALLHLENTIHADSHISSMDEAPALNPGKKSFGLIQDVVKSSGSPVRWQWSLPRRRWQPLLKQPEHALSQRRERNAGNLV